MGAVSTRSGARAARAAPAPPRLVVAELTPRAYRIGIAVCAAVAAVAAAPALGRETLGRDELETLALVDRPLSSLLSLLPERQNGMLFDLALWPVLRFGGLSETWLRLPALLAFVGAVALCASVGRRLLGGPAAGLAAAFLLAIHPFAIEFAQEGRPYTFALFFVLLSTLLLLRALERPGPVAFAAYVLAAGATLYSHDLAILALVPHLVLVLLSGHTRIKRWFLLATAALAAAGVPLLLFIPKSLDAAFWWAESPWPGPFARTIEAFGGSWAGAALCALVLAGGAVAWQRRSRSGLQPLVSRVSLAVLATWLVAPLAIILVVSIFQPTLVPRYVLPSLPALCLLLVLSALVLPRRLGVAASVVVVAALVAGTVSYRVTLAKPDWRAAAAFLDATVAPDDVIVVAGEAVQNTNALLYYSEAARGRASVRLLGSDSRPGDLSDLLRPIARPSEAGRVREALAGDSGWIVDWGGARGDIREDTRAALADCEVTERFRPRAIVVYAVECPRR